MSARPLLAMCLFFLWAATTGCGTPADRKPETGDRAAQRKAEANKVASDKKGAEKKVAEENATETKAEEGKAADKELKQLQGVWGTYLDNYAHNDGFEAIAQPITELSKHRIQGNKWVYLDARGKPAGGEKTITLGPSTSPKQIRLTYTPKSEKGQPDKQFTEYGIYKLEGDSLTVHWGPFDAEKGGGTKPAPKQFLELNKPIKGVDGLATHFGRVK